MPMYSCDSCSFITADKREYFRHNAIYHVAAPVDEDLDEEGLPLGLDTLFDRADVSDTPDFVSLDDPGTDPFSGGGGFGGGGSDGEF